MADMNENKHFKFVMTDVDGEQITLQKHMFFDPDFKGYVAYYFVSTIHGGHFFSNDKDCSLSGKSNFRMARAMMDFAEKNGIIEEYTPDFTWTPPPKVLFPPPLSKSQIEKEKKKNRKH